MQAFSAMSWLPAHIDFRPELRSAVSAVESAERWERLVCLANTRLGYVETIQLDNALRRSAEVFSDRPRIRVALLASATVDHLLPAIRVAGLRRGLLLDTYSCAFGQYRQELLDSSSRLYEFAPQYLVFSISARDIVSGIDLYARHTECDDGLRHAIGELANLWTIGRERLRAIVIQQTFLDTVEPLFGNFESLVPGAPTRLVARANQTLIETMAKERVLVLDVCAASARDGLSSWFDRGRWLQGKIEIAPGATPLYGDLVARVIAAQRGLSKKCLVLDLDNTLWAGVIGDDGIDGIRLGEGSAVGEAHSALQRYAKALKERGIVLAVCSKNDATIAERAFAEHPEMVLRRKDIAAFVANWNDKAQNLRTIADQLNIGLDSLVFVDDNAAERARIRQSLPMIAVPELPSDPAFYVSCIAEAGYFEAVSFTDEDRERAGQYAANADREALRGLAQNMDDFLKGLEMSVEFGPAQPVDIGRVTQLINKTNQFNTTTRRCDEDSMRRMADDPSNLVLKFRLVDKFGDNGLVSVMVLQPVRDQIGVLEIHTWVMSCRVFGRQLEAEAMNIAVDLAVGRGVQEIRADFVPTQRNGVVSNLYEGFGFECTACNQTTGASRWALRVSEYRPASTFINRKVQS